MFNLSQASGSSGVSRTSQLQALSRPLLNSYPKKRQGKRERCFQSSWYDSFSWLEYFENVDACFCYPCRIFAKESVKEKTFIKTGFSNWKTALETDRGFNKHQKSEVHIRAMASWKEREYRESRGQTVQNLIQLNPEHKIWLKTVFNTTKYLVANGQPFRGNEEKTNLNEEMTGGLYLNTFQDLLFAQDPNLKDIAKRLPKNAKYTSPQLQNEVIETLSEIVSETVASECKKAGLFTLMMDGTTNHSNREMEGIALRYWNETCGGIVEHIIDFKMTEDRSAKGLLSIALSTLVDEHDIPLTDGIVSNTFDGASVMSGEKGGLQQLVKEYCGRDIPYIHCLNHRLALVIKDTLSTVLELDDFFQLVQDLYNFFKIPQIDKLHMGLHLKKLITTRWDGHFSSLKVLSKSLEDIHLTLEKCKTSRLVDPEYRSKAKGYLVSLKEPVTMFLITFMMDVMKPLNLLNQMFQKHESNLITALSTLQSVRRELDQLKETYTLEYISNLVFPQETPAPDNEFDLPAKRKRTIPATLLQEYVVTEKLPCHRHDKDDVQQLRALAVEVINKLNVEFDHRFNDFNSTLWKSFEILKPCSDNFLDAEKLTPLLDYIKTIPHVFEKFEELSFQQLECECNVFRSVLKEFSDKQDRLFEIALQRKMKDEAIGRKVEDLKKEDKMSQMTEFVLTLVGAHILKQIYLVAVTAGYSSAVVECGFSALNRIDTCHRRRMTPYRQANLTLLHYENTLTKSISFEQFLEKWNSKPRRLIVIQ